MPDLTENLRLCISLEREKQREMKIPPQSRPKLLSMGKFLLVPQIFGRQEKAEEWGGEGEEGHGNWPNWPKCVSHEISNKTKAQEKICFSFFILLWLQEPNFQKDSAPCNSS